MMREGGKEDGRNGEKGGGKGGGVEEVEEKKEVWKPRILSSSAIVHHRELIGSFEMLTSVIRRDRSMRGRASH